MPKDEWGNIISEAEYDHLYRSSGRTYTTKDEWGNIVQRDERGNQVNYDSRTGRRTWVKTD